MSAQDDTGKPWVFPLDTDPETLEPLDGINRFPATIPIKRAFRPLRFVGVWGLRLMGWRSLGTLPDRGKFVVILMPHTSNVDFILAVWIFFLFRVDLKYICLLYTSPSPRDQRGSRMPSSA